MGCSIAAESLRIVRNGGSPGAVGERLLLEAVPHDALVSLGLRDLRGVGHQMTVRCASWRVGEPLRVAFCCGATAKLTPSKLDLHAQVFKWQPRALSLKWTKEALALPCTESYQSASALCVCVRDRLEDCNDACHGDDSVLNGRSFKRPRTVPGPRSLR